MPLVRFFLENVRSGFFTMTFNAFENQKGNRPILTSSSRQFFMNGMNPGRFPLNRVRLCRQHKHKNVGPYQIDLDLICLADSARPQ